MSRALTQPDHDERIQQWAALKRAFAAAGNKTQLAEKLGITPQSIGAWRRAPAERALQIEQLTGVSRYDLRPDIFGPSPVVSASARAGVESSAAPTGAR